MATLSSSQKAFLQMPLIEKWDVPQMKERITAASRDAGPDLSLVRFKLDVMLKGLQGIAIIVRCGILD